jgi:hypothetical protein
VRDQILKTFPHLEADDVRSTAMGQSGEDVQLSPAARKVLPYQIEVKNKAKSQIHTYYDQAKSHGKYEPMVVVHRDRGIYLATVSLDNLLQLLQQIENLRSSSPK